MAGGATLALKITGDSRDGVRALDDVEGKAGRMDGVFSKMGAGIAAGAAIGGAALVALGVSAFNAASDLQQSTGAIDSVFGDWAIDIEQAAQGAAGSVGLSTAAYENMASVIGAQLHGAGMAHDEMNDKTQALITTGADLAATFGGTTADAVEALSSVMKGEYDPIERYGVSLKQSDVNARLAAEGNDKLTGTALKTATANAALALITEATSSSQGAFARESDTAAGAQQRLSATWENAKAALGERLLPVVAGAATFLTGQLGPAVSALTDENGALSAAFGVVSNFVTGQLIPAVSSLWDQIGPKLVPILQTAGAVLTDNLVPAFAAVWDIVQNYVFPIIGSVLGPALTGLKGAWDKLAGALADNRDKFQGIYDKVKPMLEYLRDTVAPFVGGALKLGFEALGAAIGPVVSTITWLLDKAADVTGFLGTVGSFLFGGPSTVKTKPTAAPAGAARLLGATAAPVPLFGATRSLSGGTSPTAGQGPLVPVGDTYNITVTGALDASAVADQIGQLLDRRARRTGTPLALAGAR